MYIKIEIEYDHMVAVEDFCEENNLKFSYEHRDEESFAVYWIDDITLTQAYKLGCFIGQERQKEIQNRII